MTLTWTREPPSVPGWYWIRTYARDGRERVAVVSVQRRMECVYDNEGPAEKVGMSAKGAPGFGSWILASHIDNAEWSGPIPEPTDAPAMAPGDEVRP